MLSVIVLGLLVQVESKHGLLTEFYSHLSTGNVDRVMSFFHDKAVYFHTDRNTASGDLELRKLFSSMLEEGETIAKEVPSVIDVQLVGGTAGAAAFLAERPPMQGEGTQTMRDSIFVVNNTILRMMTTRANPHDPKTAIHEDKQPQASGGQVDINHDPKQVEFVQKVVDSYFDGFNASDPVAMQKTFGNQPFLLFDYNKAIRAPLGCAESDDCSSAFYLNNAKELASAFKAFTDGYINIRHKFDVIRIYGDIAVATTESTGCEGENQTPNGRPPVPFREQFVLLRSDNVWKIHSLMFTYDPEPTLEAPVDTCPPRTKPQEPQCIQNALVGHCLELGCWEDHGTASCVNTFECRCDPGSCSHDGWHCVPTPTTTTVTTITTTTTTVTTTTRPFKARKSNTCNPKAIVGHCLLTGCFRGHGNAHCSGVNCLCDEGSCSIDGWKCISSPNPSSSEAEDTLLSVEAEEPEIVEPSSYFLWLVLACAVVTAGILRVHRSRSGHALVAPLLQ